MGKIDESTFPFTLRSKTQFAVDFRKLEEEMVKEGLFEPTDFYYMREFLKCTLLFCTAFYMVFNCEHTLTNILIASFLHAFGN